MRNAKPKRGDHKVGVWSPFGETYHPHGEVELALGRKPAMLQQEAAVAAVPTAAVPSDATVLPPPQRYESVPRELPYPPVLRRGLGLGLGPHPQRFPRELLKSAEQRVVACHAGHAASAVMSGSKSDPLLARRLRHHPSFLPSPPTTAETDLNAIDDEDDDSETKLAPPSPLPLSKVLPSLPVGSRAAVEWKGVQRRTRLQLQDALEERQRMKASVFALKHAQQGIGSLVLGGRATHTHARPPARTHPRTHAHAHRPHPSAFHAPRDWRTAQATAPRVL